MEESYYIGTDLKFKLDIQASGFNMGTDDYNITLVQGNQRMDIPKDDIVEGDDGYYLLLDTTRFHSGMVKMIVTAYVPDDDFESGVRREVAVADLCYIKNV